MEAIRYYVAGAFQGVQVTPEVLEQQEELVADLTAKVADLVSEGKSEEEALGMAIASVGDLSALVAEFGPAEDIVAAPAVATVKSTKLDLHVAAISALIGGAVMIASAAMGALSTLIHPGAAFSLLAVLALGIWWVRGAYQRYEADPDATEVRPLDMTAEFRKALWTWAIVVAGSMFLNAVSGGSFWCWPLWVAGGTWALTFKVAANLIRHPEFRAPAEADVQ